AAGGPLDADAGAAGLLPTAPAATAPAAPAPAAAGARAPGRQHARDAGLDRGLAPGGNAEALAVDEEGRVRVVGQILAGLGEHARLPVARELEHDGERGLRRRDRDRRVVAHGRLVGD